MPTVNPDILKWARETAALTLEDAAAKLNIGEARGVPAETRLAAYEAGEREPSRPLLVRMAKQYRRPLLTFYMSQAPRLGERGQDFRTLPPEHSTAQDALVDALIRDVRARQQMVRAALEDEEEILHSRGAGNRRGDGCPALPAIGRGNLGLSEQRSGGAAGMELERAGAAAIIRHPHLDRAYAGAEIDIPVLRPKAWSGIPKVESAIRILIGAGFGLEPAESVVTGSLDPGGCRYHGGPARLAAGIF